MQHTKKDTLITRWASQISASFILNGAWPYCLVHFFLCLYSPSKHQKTQLRRKAEESKNNVEVPKFDITYKELMAMVVCDTTNLECMVHHCKNCPGYSALEKLIRKNFTELEIDGEMSCSQWESIDRTTLQTQLMWMISSSYSCTVLTILRHTLSLQRGMKK